MVRKFWGTTLIKFSSDREFEKIRVNSSTLLSHHLKQVSNCAGGKEGKKIQAS